MQRNRGSISQNNENCTRILAAKKLNSTATTVTTVTIQNEIVTKQRNALGDIGNRVVNRSLAALAVKKSTSNVVESKKDDVLNALRKIEPRKPLRATASCRLTQNPNVPAAALPPKTAVVVARNASMKSTVQFGNAVDYQRPTELSKLKSIKLTRSNSVAALPPKIVKSKETVPVKFGSQVELRTIAAIAPPSIEDENISKEDKFVSADSSEIKNPNSYSTAMIPNIDEEDNLNPQLVSDFVNDIYDYMRLLECQQAVRENYLNGQDITGRMRAVLLDWLVQVHVRFHLLPETMYMTAMLIDRFLQDKTVPKEKLQLVGVTAMFVASKYEEMYAPEIGDFVYITDNSYSKEQVRSMERHMLQSLDFRLGKPLPIHFLRRYSKAADADPIKHTLAKYFMELSLVEYSMCHHPPSIIAAAALYLSLKLLGDGIWTPTLVHYTKYTESDIAPVIRKLCQAVHKAHSESPKLQMIVTTLNGKTLLKSWLKRVMKIKLTDGRTVVGVFMCTDSECNLILGQCREYKMLSAVDDTTPSDDLNSEEPRILGLAMVPGHHIVSISVDVNEQQSETSPLVECGINL